MKNAFEVNVTTKENGCDKFIVKKISPELQRKHDEMYEAFAMIQKNSSIPLWLSIIYFICLFVATTFTCGFFDAAMDVGFAAAYNNASWLPYVDGICIVFAAAVFFYKLYKKKSIQQSPAVQSKLEESKRLNRQCYEELCVPCDADDIDVFALPVKTKNGKMKQATVFQYANTECKIFKDFNNLYIADVNAVYGFPLNSFTKIAARNKNATFDSWNKEEPFNKGVYKQFKVRRNNMGIFFIKPHHSLQFFAFNEEYEIVIPNYELQTLLKYVNLNVMYENK